MADLSELIQELRDIRPALARMLGSDSETVRTIDTAVEFGDRDEVARAVRLIRREERLLGEERERYQRMCRLAQELLGSGESVV